MKTEFVKANYGNAKIDSTVEVLRESGVSKKRTALSAS